MMALKKIKWLEDVFITRTEEQGFLVNIQTKTIFAEAIAELEELQKDEMFILLQELKEVNNTDSNDFLDHIKRTAKAILKKDMR